MNILAFDTSDAVLSVALEVGPSAEGGSFWYTEVDAGTRHSELLMPCADWLCRSAGIQPEQVGLVACMEGPGSFTGLRIGFSAAKGIALAFGVPLTAVPTLDCIAEPLSFWRGITVAAIDAKKGCFFTALYRQGTRLTEYMDASPQRIADEIAQVQGSERE
ncbi:MAG: tRNA (adenosine(37)-N6)-threonylcarbamoyltransferase complex dimerization subunit type 1 TsaB, partial [Treponema sp.]|nr:tRNA (adenosine(37)-N6)-threonylcarbamoyltransferase complex dimerization subunit type 1 TsaB [Treponema sp.]